jgi:periplasmic protein TonB
MIWIIISAIVIAAVSFYDFSWSNATNNIRNEVVFENRHKTYGAYALRVEYGRQVIISFITVALLFGGLIYASKYMGGGKMSVITTDTEGDYKIVDVDQPKKPKVEVYKLPTLTQPPPKFDLFKLVNPTAKNDPVLDSLPDMKNKMAGNVNAKGDTSSNNNKLVLEDLPIDDKKCLDCPPAEYVVAQVEELPAFKGWKEYLKKNLKVPQDALEIGIQGKVYVEFTVMADGSVANVKIKSGLLKSVDNEAVRIIKNMPAKWEPGKINGNAVNVRLVQPITINANK